jgi:hypothetical protein
MHDAGKILLGLAIFLAIVISPIWYQWAMGTKTGPPELRIVTESQKCVEPTAYMRAFHMDMLNNWRDEAVRSGDRLHVGIDGKEYDKSLSGTCIMSCHSNRAEFCDRCHEYVAVKPHCWGCHAVDEAESVARRSGENRGEEEGGDLALRMGRYGT